MGALTKGRLWEIIAVPGIANPKRSFGKDLVAMSDIIEYLL